MKHPYRIINPATGLPTEIPSYSGVPSAEAAPEIAGPVGVVAAVATGSLPVSAAEALLAQWDHLANFHAASRRAKDHYGRGYSAGLADAYTIAATQLRQQMAASNERQPEENKADQHNCR